MYIYTLLISLTRSLLKCTKALLFSPILLLQPSSTHLHRPLFQHTFSPLPPGPSRRTSLSPRGWVSAIHGSLTGRSQIVVRFFSCSSGDLFTWVNPPLLYHHILRTVKSLRVGFPTVDRYMGLEEKPTG